MRKIDTEPLSWQKQLPEAYAYHQVITNEAGVPVDYVFLQVNPAFEGMTGFKAEDIIGRRVTEVLPGIESDEFDWISIFGQVGLTGEACKFEQYSAPLDKWFNVIGYSDTPGYFEVLFHDISGQQREKEKLQKMMRFSQRFLDTENVPDLQEITEFMRTLTGAFSAVFNQLEDNGLILTTKAIAIKSQHLLKAADMLGFNPIGKKWSRDPKRQAMIQQDIVTTFENLQSFTVKSMPVQMSRLLEKTFDIGQMAIIKTMKKDKAIGEFTLIMPKGTSMESKELAILYATQVGMHLDRVQYEEDLRKQRQRLEGIIEGTHVGTWEWNVQTGETIFNERWAEMVGYALEEIEPTSFDTWTAFVHPVDSKASEAQLQEVFNGKKEYYDVDCRMKHRDGHWIWVHDRGKVITWTEDGKPLMMSGTHTDITVRKRAEETLLASKVQLETLSDNIPNGMVYQQAVNPQGNRRFTYVSAGVERLQGVTQAEVLNNSKILYDQLHEEDKQKLIEAEKQALITMKPFSLEARIRKPDGTFRWVQFQEALSKSPDDSIVADGIAIDVTKRKKAEENLQEYASLLKLKNQELDVTAKEAEKANQAKSRYLAHMNHEVRTPLNGFLGFLQLMKSTNLDGQQQEYMHYMEQSTSHMLGIINNVLDMAKIEAGEMQLTNRIFSLGEEIETALAPLRSLASQKNIYLQITNDENLPHKVVGDPNRLRQIALNLGGNAVKFTKKGRVLITVQCLETTQKHHILQMVVEDTGPGMTQETLDKMFLPFYQADDGSTPQSKGTGLGMTITRELVELMDGQIQVDSTPGKGTRIEVILKLSNATDNHEDRAPKQADNVDKPPETYKGLQILVAEDNELNQLLMRRILEKKGHICKIVANGQQAVEEAADNDYDLILMDIQLPLMDGREATREIRSRTDIHQPIIIAVTAFTSWEDQQTFKAAGMDGFLAKPITFEDLGKVLDGVSKEGLSNDN